MLATDQKNATHIIGRFKNHSDAVKAARKVGWKNGAMVVVPPSDTFQRGGKRKDFLVLINHNI